MHDSRIQCSNLDMENTEPDVCGFCGKGKEIEPTCGKLYITILDQKQIAAHKMCMQYSSGLCQFKVKCKKFGNFDPAEVQKELRRGKRLVCAICRGDDTGKPNKRLSQYEQWMRGATAGCAVGKCPHTYHLPCAMENGILKRIKKTFGKKTDIIYKVYCGKVHLSHDWDSMTRAGRKEGFKFTNTATDSEEETKDADDRSWERMSDDESPKQAPKRRKRTKKKKNGALNVQDGEPSVMRPKGYSPIISDDSDFDMASSQHYPSKTKTKGTKNKTKGSKSKGAIIDTDTDTEANSSDEEEMIPRHAKPKKKTTRKRVLSPSKKSTETPLKGEDTVPRSSQRSSSKKLVRPNGQPMITVFLPDRKHVKRNLTLMTDTDDSDDPQKSVTPNNYTTVSMGETEIFLFTPERNPSANDEPRPSTSTSELNNDDDTTEDDNDKANGYESSESDIEIIGVTPGNNLENPQPPDFENNTVDPDEESIKRAGGSVEEPEIKKIKIEPESLAADSTSEPKESETAVDPASVTPVEDCTVSSNSMVEELTAKIQGMDRKMGADDFILCVTERRITDALDGIQLAARVRAAIGDTLPLQRIAFWRHTLDASHEKCSDQDMQYRLLFMEDWTKHLVRENGEKLNNFTFLQPSKDVERKIDLIKHSYKHFNRTGSNNPYEEYLEKVRNSVKEEIQAQTNDWKIQYINDNDGIVIFIHISEQLDRQMFMRKKLNFGQFDSKNVYRWERNNDVYVDFKDIPSEIVRYYSASETRMVDDIDRTTCGGYSVYFDSSFTDWWKEVERRAIRCWLEDYTASGITIHMRPDEMSLIDTKNSLVHNFRTECEERKQSEEESEDNNSQTVKERALLFVYPVLYKVVNVVEYLKLVVPKFCEDKVTARNGTEAVCIADVEGLSVECLCKLVQELHVLLDNYDVSIVTGVEPGKGPISCLCLHVAM